jgi:hypothetical protein
MHPTHKSLLIGDSQQEIGKLVALLLAERGE